MISYKRLFSLGSCGAAVAGAPRYLLTRSWALAAGAVFTLTACPRAPFGVLFAVSGVLSGDVCLNCQ